MIAVIFIFLFVVIFNLLKNPFGLKYLVAFDISIQILTANINDKYSIILPPPDIFALLVFINFIMYAIKNNRSYVFKFNWVDRLLFSYLIIVLLLPGLVNLFVFNVELTYKYFIPIRFWLVYRNYTCYLIESHFRRSNTVNLKYIFKTMINVGLISAIISISRFFTYPGVKVIEDIWPVYYEQKQIVMAEWGRMVGTMSDTNGAGNYFCFLTLISLFFLNIKNLKTIIYPFIFGISVILTGSFSSIAALVVVLILYFRKNLLSGKFIFIIIIISAIFYALNKTQIFAEKINRRIDAGYYSEKGKSILPGNLQARIGYWENFTKILYSEGRIMFGMGPRGFHNYQYGMNNVLNQNAESFYFRIINESGVIAISFVFFLFISVYKKISSLESTNLNIEIIKLLKLMMLVYLIAGVANETLYYGSNSSLFGIILSLVAYLRLQNKPKITPEFETIEKIA